MTMQRPTFFPAWKKQSITHLFLGIDFGTSFTKVSYSYAFSNKLQIHTLKWENSSFEEGYIIPTILYVQNDLLFFDRPESDCLEVKYFKYSILEKKLKNKNNRQKTSCDFEEMCCVYYLAQVIKRSLEKIKSELLLQNFDGIDISINMGVPLENFYEDEKLRNKDRYQDILENAVVLAGGSKIFTKTPQNQVEIKNLDFVYNELIHKKAILNWRVNVFPELAAEILLYHMSKTVPSSCYAVIDIGGGTVDLALFQKYKGIDNNYDLNCLGQKVLPYGAEIIYKKAYPFEQIEQIFSNTFWEIFERAKKFINVRFEQIEVFFFGGGSLDPIIQDFYMRILNKRNNNRIKFNHTIKDLFLDEESLIVKNQRLIISQMLAKSIQEIDNVKSFPNFYESELEERLKAPMVYDDYHSELEDILNERYPK